MGSRLNLEIERLNRTSVGLKLRDRTLDQPHGERLNRTSVGLKRGRSDPQPHQVPEPQSNQRGIETQPTLGGASVEPAASIEPAWD